MEKLILDKDVFNVRFIEESILNKKRKLAEWFKASSLRLEISFTFRGFKSCTFWVSNNILCVICIVFINKINNKSIKKYVNLENYSLEDFYIDIDEYFSQLNNVGDIHYLGICINRLFIGDSIAFKLIDYRSITILYEQIHARVGKLGDNKLILILSPISLMF